MLSAAIAKVFGPFAQAGIESRGRVLFGELGDRIDSAQEITPNGSKKTDAWNSSLNPSDT
jgi:hypothetical protein